MPQCIFKTKKGTQCERVALKGSEFCRVHRRKRNWWRTLSFSVIGVIALGVLGFIANVAGVLDFLGIKPPPLIYSQFTPTFVLSPSPDNSFFSGSSIELISINDRRIIIENDDHVISSGDIIRVGETITVTFRILNNGLYSATIKSLIIGARGPGVSCEDKNEKKWTAPDNPFPPIVDITLEVGQEYEYKGSRSFYKPGTYFLEPILQSTEGIWGGIPPFTCVDISVI